MFFFFNDTATTEIYTLSLHDALPISGQRAPLPQHRPGGDGRQLAWSALERGLRVQLRRPDTRSFAQLLPGERGADERSEEHTSELQSRQYLVCRLLLEKKQITLLTYA